MDLDPFRGQRVLITDFDGTLTQFDFFDRAFHAVAPGTIPDYWGQYERGEIGHFEALAKIFAALPFSADELKHIARQSQLEPELAECLARLNGAGWRVVVVSAGCRWYIEGLLAERGIELPLLANPGRPAEGTGLIMERPSDSPYANHEVGVDKLAFTEAVAACAAITAYAGDGRPDVAPIQRMAAPYRFAKGYAAEALTRSGHAFTPFARWREVADRLTS